MNLLEIRNRYRKIVAKRRTRKAIRQRISRDPVLAMLAAAPLTKDSMSEVELESLREGWGEYQAGLTVSSEEIKQAFREKRHAATR